MESLGIIQARMSSHRFPGKVLALLDQRTVLEWVAHRLNQSKELSFIVVATSTETTDDPIVDHCRSLKIATFRGDLENVAARFGAALIKYNPKFFVRICADSPFIDPSLVDQGLKIMKQGDFDLVTNKLPRSYPKGQTIEVIKTETYMNSLPKFVTQEEQEHVTPFFYENLDKFKIANFTADRDYSAINLCVDTTTDLEAMRKLLTEKRAELGTQNWKHFVDSSYIT